MKKLLTLFLLLSAVGCQVDQKREVETYRKLLRLTPNPVEHAAGQELPLLKAMLLANQNDEQLASRGEEFLKARIQEQRTFANFLPTVDLAPVYSRRGPPLSSSSGGDGAGSGSSARRGTLDVPVDGSINLFNGFRDVNARWRDAYISQQRQFELLFAQEQLLLDTASIYYQVLRSEASVGVLESSLKLQDERYRDVKGKLDAGLSSPLAVSQTEAQIAQTRTTLISAHDDVVQARLRLALLTAADIHGSKLDDSYNPPATLPLEELLARAIHSRGDLRAAENAVSAARYDVEVAVGQYYPSVTLDLTGYLYRETVPDERKWDALLSLNLPIFSAGRIEADVRTAWSNLRQALLARSRADRTVQSEVRQAYRSLQASEARLAQLKVQVDVAQQALDQAEQLYRAGRATNLDRVQAQDALLQAQLQQASETYDRKLFYLTLLQRAGQLREEFADSETRTKAGDVDHANTTTQPTTKPATSTK